MAKYTPHTESDISVMLNKIGVSKIDDLFCDIPKEVKLSSSLNIDSGISEMECERKLKNLANKNKVFSTILLGAGAESHYIPPVVRELSSRSEFVTAYTPYQAEISQGILQGIFEYQSEICDLTGMDVSNASLYDGATAIAEGAIMTAEVKKEVVVANDINPQYLAVLHTYAASKGIEIKVAKTKDGRIDFSKVDNLLSQDTACVIVQNPNFYGLFEDVDTLFSRAKAVKAKCVYAFNPIMTSIMKTPKGYGADIAVAEGQPLGLPMSFGGPYLGILACTKELSRKMPGRVVGETVDKDGKRAFVFTMQAREQHIRREKALSSICSNEALCALTASMYLSVVGKNLCDIANRCVNNAHYFAKKLCEINSFHLLYDGEFAYEFATSCDNADVVLNALIKNDILGGLKLSDKNILWCVTENVEKSQLDYTIEVIKGAL